MVVDDETPKHTSAQKMHCVSMSICINILSLIVNNCRMGLAIICTTHPRTNNTNKTNQ